MIGALETPEISALATLVEEVTRSTREGVKRFVEPASGTLGRAKSDWHHIVFGRRGSGKTSLLRKAQIDLAEADRPIAFVDLEPFKGLSYPDVLISVLIESFRLFKEWTDDGAPRREAKRSLRNLFGAVKSKKGGLEHKAADALSRGIAEAMSQLKAQLQLPDGAELQRVVREEQQSAIQGDLGSRVGLHGVAELTSMAAVSDEERAAQQTQETYRRSKIDFLHQHMLDYREVFRQLSQLSGGSSFLFLDDLYHIRRSDQPKLLDYFHGIAKGNDLWLKIGTIRQRSQWYVHGDPPTGLKLGDDAEEIDLDLTLERYSGTKAFLVSILEGLVKESSKDLDTRQFLSEGAVDRLVLASGGVARDFLGIFRRSIDQARERLERQPQHHRGQKIGAEDVNRAAGRYGDMKMEEFRRDTLDDQQRLEEALSKVSDFCINSAQANCFLLDQDSKGGDTALVQELVDLRLVHLVTSRVTVSARRGRVYRAYLLDVSQYTGSRRRRRLQMLEPWRTGSSERLRRVSLLYDPSAQ